MYQVTEEQLDNLASGHYAIWLTIAAACFGAFISLLGTFATSYNTVSATSNSIVAGLLVGFGIATLVVGTQAAIALRQHTKALHAFKHRRSRSE